MSLRTAAFAALMVAAFMALSFHAHSVAAPGQMLLAGL